MRWTVDRMRAAAERLDCSGEADDWCAARELVARALQGEADEILTPELAEQGTRLLKLPLKRPGRPFEYVKLLDPGDFSSPNARRQVMELQAFHQLRELREGATS